MSYLAPHHTPINTNTVHLRRSLESLQSTVGRCRVSHWLLRVLTAEDVRQSLERGLANTSDALQELLQADATADVVRGEGRKASGAREGGTEGRERREAAAAAVCVASHMPSLS